MEYFHERQKESLRGNETENLLNVENVDKFIWFLFSAKMQVNLLDMLWLRFDIEAIFVI